LHFISWNLFVCLPQTKFQAFLASISFYSFIVKNIPNASGIISLYSDKTIEVNIIEQAKPFFLIDFQLVCNKMLEGYLIFFRLLNLKKSASPYINTIDDLFPSKIIFASRRKSLRVKIAKS